LNDKRLKFNSKKYQWWRLELKYEIVKNSNCFLKKVPDFLPFKINCEKDKTNLNELPNC
jgi:hypothetical protein